MTRNLKALGLALLAVFALSAVAASAASAANDVFTSTAATTDLTGHSNNPELTLGEKGKEEGVVCETGTYSGKIEGKKVAAATVHPVYEGTCLAFGIFHATVNTDGCDFVLTGDTDANGHASAHIECTNEGEITIAVYETAAEENTLLTLHIPPQTVRGTASDTIEVNGHDALTVTSTVEKQIHGTCTGEFCFLVGGEEFTEASYYDDVTTTGWEDTGEFTRNSTTHVWSGSHGTQVDITDHEE